MRLSLLGFCFQQLAPHLDTQFFRAVKVYFAFTKYVCCVDLLDLLQNTVLARCTEYQNVQINNTNQMNERLLSHVRVGWVGVVE